MAIDNPPNHNHGTSEKDTTPPPPLPVVSPGHRNQDTSVLDLGDEEEVEYLDGGLKAWLVVVGIVQNYYQETLLKSSSPSTIAWIGSIQYALVFLPGLVVGRLFDMGHIRSIFITSSIILVVATFLVAECNKYWHFLLCQGIVVELGCGGLFVPMTAIVSHWFKKRCGIVMGWVAVGSALGGTLLPIAGKSLLPIVGFKWTLRIFGFILLTILTVSNLLLKRRLPPRKLEGGILNLRAFTNATYAVYCLAAASQTGISSNFAFYLFAFANASSLAGRLCAGRVSDRFGPMNVMVPFTAVAGILTYAWPFAETESSLIAVTVLYGFCTGAYVALTTNPIIAMGEMHDVGRRTGMFISVLALGSLAGPPISGAINADTGGFKVMGCYAGQPFNFPP
ncbi:MFS general substrate transporter [Agrocybe pediades]|nr:MFS general substrate transporter [Agrocybe pediades]